jgi:hypothetical protein
MSTVIAHMRAAATLDEAARLIADYLRSMAEDISKCAQPDASPLGGEVGGRGRERERGTD